MLKKYKNDRCRVPGCTSRADINSNNNVNPGIFNVWGLFKILSNI